MKTTMWPLFQFSQDFRKASSLVIALAAISLYGCESLTDVPTSLLLTIDVVPNMATIGPGETADFQVTVTRSGVYADEEVDLSVGGPSGLDGSFSQETLPPGDDTSTLSLTNNGIAPGLHDVYVAGSLSDVGGTAIIQVDVPAPPAPFSLSATGGEEVPQGGQLDVMINLTRDPGFTDAVDMNVRLGLSDNLPQGITASFNPDPIPTGATESTLTFFNSGALTGRQYELIIEGTAPDGTMATVDYGITVPKGGGGGSGWQVVHSLSGGPSLLDVDFPTNSVGYAVGNDGFGSSSLKSDDGGENWSALSVPAAGLLTRVQFLTATTGFVAGLGNTLLKTTDGGSNWTDLGSNISVPLDVRAIYFLDELHGYVGGGSDASTPPTLVYTQDGGLNWNEISGPWTSHTSNAIRSLHFSSTTHGFVSHSVVDGTSPVNYTTDGGQNWSDGSGSTSTFVNLFSGFAVDGTDEVYSWSADGATWNSLGTVSAPSVPMLDGVASQGGTPWVVGGRSNVGSILAVIAYQNGGSWTIDYDGLIDGVFRLFDIEMFSGTEGVAVGFDSILRRYP